MRDRLIELIKKARCAKECMGMNDIEVCKVTCQTYTTCGIIADYLLENGVIVPPCKVGDTVYRIVEMSTGVRYKHKSVHRNGYEIGLTQPCLPTIKRFIRSVTVTKNNIADCCEKYGKQVFLTKGEAEEVLKERLKESTYETR